MNVSRNLTYTWGWGGGLVGKYIRDEYVSEWARHPTWFELKTTLEETRIDGDVYMEIYRSIRTEEGY